MRKRRKNVFTQNYKYNSILYIVAMPISKNSNPAVSTGEIVGELNDRDLQFTGVFEVQTFQKISAKSRDGRQYERESVVIKAIPSGRLLRWIPRFDSDYYSIIKTSLLINPDQYRFNFIKDEKGNYILHKAL